MALPTETEIEIDWLAPTAVPAKKLVLMIPNGVLDSVVKGTDAGASEALYTRRLKAIVQALEATWLSHLKPE